MIPKVIHYCWFGKGKLPELAEKCIKSWKKYCPDYEIIEWNENNFDINTNTYVKEAYENRKFAFVSDYVRIYAMYNFGGIYMDTDVEVTKNLDEFLIHQAFSGFENDTQIPTGIMGCEKNFPLFKNLLDYYKNRHFINAEGKMDMTTNVITITKILLQEGFVPNGKFQIVNGFALYPREVFCPLDSVTWKLNRTEKTATIHWFNQSWVSGKDRMIGKITRIFHRFFGPNCFNVIKKIVGRGYSS